MNKENIYGIVTVMLTALLYTFYTWPTTHIIFGPITFWQKFAMFFTVDIITLVFTLIIAAMIVEGLNKIYDMIF